MPEEKRNALDNIAESVKKMTDEDKERFEDFAEGFRVGVKFNGNLSDKEAK